MGWGMSSVARARSGAVALLFVVMMACEIVPAGASTAPALSETPDHTASFNGVVRAVTYHRGVAYLGGDFTAAVQDGVTVPRRHLAAVDATTGRLLPWAPRTNGSVSALRVTDRWTYLGGAFTKVGKRAHAHVARVRTPSGRVDRRFRPAANGPVAAVGGLRPDDLRGRRLPSRERPQPPLPRGARDPQPEPCVVTGCPSRTTPSTPWRSGAVWSTSAAGSPR